MGWSWCPSHSSRAPLPAPPRPQLRRGCDPTGGGGVSALGRPPRCLRGHFQEHRPLHLWGHGHEEGYRLPALRGFPEKVEVQAPRGWGWGGDSAHSGTAARWSDGTAPVAQDSPPCLLCGRIPGPQAPSQPAGGWSLISPEAPPSSGQGVGCRGPGGAMGRALGLQPGGQRLNLCRAAYFLCGLGRERPAL